MHACMEAIGEVNHEVSGGIGLRERIRGISSEMTEDLFQEF